MMPAMTEEEIIEFGKSIGKSVLRRASIQERLEGIPAEEVLHAFPAKDRLEGIAAKDRLEGIPPQDLREYLSQLSEDMKQLIGLRLSPEA